MRFVAEISEDLLSLLEQPLTLTYTLPGETAARTSELTGFQRNNYGDSIAIDAEEGMLFAYVEVPHLAAGTIEYQLQARALADPESTIDTAKTYHIAASLTPYVKGNRDNAFATNIFSGSTSDVQVSGKKVAIYIEALLSEDPLFTQKHSVTVPIQ